MDSKKLCFGAGLAVSVAAAYFLYTRRKEINSASTSRNKVISVTQLWVYPIKSCSGMALIEAKLGMHGFEYDREWVVVRTPTTNEDGTKSPYTVLTQRENQKMKLVTASIDRTDACTTLVLSAEGVDSVEVPVVSEANLKIRKTMEIEKWGLFGGFVSEGKDVASWLSNFLGENVFLARCIRPRNPNEMDKYTHLMKPSDRILGHDFSTLHVLSEEGLAWIRRESKNPLLNAARFRPNIVVAGTEWPEEDIWNEFTVGDVELRSCKLCSRCAIPTIDEAGKLNKAFQPTATLRDVHSKPAVPDDHSSEPKPMFGLNVFHNPPSMGGASIALGDFVNVRSVRK